MRQSAIVRPSPGFGCRTVDPAFVRQVFGKLRGRSPRIDILLTDDEAVRLARAASHVPVAKRGGRLADFGGTLLWVPIYVKLLGYRSVTIVCRSGESFLESYGTERVREIVGEDFELRMVHANLDVDPYDIESDSVDCVVSFEILEHLPGDPFHMFFEANRVLKPGGAFCLTTPNVLSADNIVRFMFGGQPNRDRR